MGLTDPHLAVRAMYLNETQGPDCKSQSVILGDQSSLTFVENDFEERTRATRSVEFASSKFFQLDEVSPLDF